MAAVGTIDKDIEIGETEHFYVGRIALDAVHIAAGEAVDFTANAQMHTLICENKSGYSFEWDAANQKLIVYYVDNNAAGDSAQIAVPDATDLSAVTNIQFLAVGS